MYIRLTRSQMDPAKYDELVGMGQEIAAAITSQPGCQNYASGGDRVTGETITVTTWDTKEQARGLSGDAGVLLSAVMHRLQAIGVQVEPPEIYESF